MTKKFAKAHPKVPPEYLTIYSAHLLNLPKHLGYFEKSSYHASTVRGCIETGLPYRDSLKKMRHQMKQKKSLLCYKSARKPNWVWGNIRLCGRCTRSAQLCAQPADNKVNWVGKFQAGYQKLFPSYRTLENPTKQKARLKRINV